MQVDGRLWLTLNGENLAGNGRIELLKHIGTYGSMRQAALQMGMSYKAAWDAIDGMSKLVGEPLVERSTGGKGGGGTILTPRGERLITAFLLMKTEHQRFLHALSGQIEDFSETYQLIRKIAMKTSARNQFFGQVTAIKTGAVNDEIELELAGGDKLVAIITHESTEHLGLKVGIEAVALIKAPWVMVATGQDSLKLSARNQLAGQVVKLVEGAVNAEVVIQLAGGTTVVAIITNDSVQTLGLAEGVSATAIFKASHVIIGVLD